MSTTRKPPVLGLILAGERFFGMGRSASYDAAKRGQLTEGVPVIRAGGTFKVPTSAIEHALGIDVLDYLTEDELIAESPVEVAVVSATTPTVDPITELFHLPARLERATIPIAVRLDVTVDVPCYVSDEFPGLAVTSIVSPSTGEMFWSLTHIESGRSLPFPGVRLETNLLVAVKAGELHDWTSVHLGDDVSSLAGVVQELHRYSRLLSARIELDAEQDGLMLAAARDRAGIAVSRQRVAFEPVDD